MIALPLSLWITGWKLVYGVSTIVVALFCLPLISSTLSLVLFYIDIENNYWSWINRTHYTLIRLAALIFIPFLAYWNLLGFQV